MFKFLRESLLDALEGLWVHGEGAYDRFDCSQTLLLDALRLTSHVDHHLLLLHARLHRRYLVAQTLLFFGSGTRLLSLLVSFS